MAVRWVLVTLDKALAPAALHTRRYTGSMKSVAMLQGVTFQRDHGFSMHIDSLSIEPGSMTLLLGASGSGKSTLLWLIAGLLRSTSGSIEIAGERLDTLHEAGRDRLRARRMGLVFQTHHLLADFTAEENVSLALMAAGESERTHHARSLELLASLGIDRPTAKASQLSVVQQQRVAVDRAIACRPVLVLADEPTASLDAANRDIAMDVLQQACRTTGAALVCASHDPSLASRFQRTLDVNAFVSQKVVA